MVWRYHELDFGRANNEVLLLGGFRSSYERMPEARLVADVARGAPLSHFSSPFFPSSSLVVGASSAFRFLISWSIRNIHESMYHMWPVRFFTVGTLYKHCSTIRITHSQYLLPQTCLALFTFFSDSLFITPEKFMSMYGTETENHIIPISKESIVGLLCYFPPECRNIVLR